MRRSVKTLAWTLGVLLGLPMLLIAVVLLGANTQAGRDLIERMVPELTGGAVMLQGLDGNFPAALRAASIEVRDPEGTWLVIEHLTLDWAPWRLLIGEALIDRLAAARIGLERLPVDSSEPSESSAATLPLRIGLRSLDVTRLDIAPAVTGIAETFSIKGHARLATLDRGDVLLEIQGRNGSASYRLDGSFDPTKLAAKLHAEEPANGPVARLAGLEDLGTIRLNASMKGPRAAVATELSLDAGPLSARARGKLDLLEHAAELKVTASAPAMRPRPDVSWQSVSLDATLSGPFAKPAAVGTLLIAGLNAGGAEVGTIAADIQGEAGQVQLHASLEGLRIPGEQPEALATAPVIIQAEARLDMPERPVNFMLEHPLIRAKGKAQTAKEIQALIFLDLPDLAPLAAVAGADLQGHSELELRATEKSGETRLDAEGTVGLTGGAPPLPGLLGDSAKIIASGALHAQDLSLSRLQIDGKTIRLSADGELVSHAVKLNWRVVLSDLAVLIPTISGTLQANGRLQGPPDDFSATVDLSGELATKGLPRAPIRAHLDAKGLPKAPTGEIRAQGTLAGSVLDLAVVAEQSSDGTARFEIKRADWKSAHAEGQLTLAPGAHLPLGMLDLRMTQLEDLSPLIGQSSTGSVIAKLETRQEGGETHARLALDARAAGLSGTALVDRLTLTANVLGPTAAPVVDAELVVDGLSAKGVAGSGRLEAKGPQDALALQLAADARNLAGSPLRLTGEAVLDATGSNLSLSALQASWKGETLRLLAPAQFAFADGLDLESLRVGIQQAVLAVSGRISPLLDVTAEVRNLSPALATAFVPDLKAEGKLRADAKLAGTLAQPTGTVQVDATGLRMRTGPARSLPPANLTATAELAGERARIDSRLSLGSKANLNLTGQAPLSSTGRMDLQARGSIDLVLADPILAASGRLVRGQVQLDAGVAGTLASPRLSGTVQLTRGEIRDYAQGLQLTGIDALLQLEGESLRIARLIARAGPGTVSASGTLGILARDMPIDLRLEARDARPLSSDLLTVSLNADLAATGQLAKQLLLSGDIRTKRAEIRIPETLPVSIATLNVRRPGEKPPPPPAPGPVVKLDLGIEAPGQVFVRGRGLDAELGGRVRVQGTADNPRPIGSFELRRGRYSLAGRVFNFAKGEVSFNGGSLTDPSLDFTVRTTSGSTTAELNIGGTVSDPRITLSSTPELPQDEILAEILFGRSASSLSPFELAQIASALAELTGVTSGGLNPLSSIRKGLRIDQLSVTSGAGGQAALEAGRYVAPGVFIGVEQGASVGSREAKVQVDLTKHLKLEGTVGTSAGSATGSSSEGGSGIGVTYEFEY